MTVSNAVATFSYVLSIKKQQKPENVSPVPAFISLLPDYAPVSPIASRSCHHDSRHSGLKSQTVTPNKPPVLDSFL